ncbi:hypothetical protein [Lacinutrix salivirga]
MEHSKHETEYLKKLKEKGYTSSFRLVNGQLIELHSKKEFAPQQITVEDEFRFEGMSNPSDLSILYAITTDSGLKGTVLASYGPKGDLDIAEFFNNIPKSNYNTN